MTPDPRLCTADFIVLPSNSTAGPFSRWQISRERGHGPGGFGTVLLPDAFGHGVQRIDNYRVVIRIRECRPFLGLCQRRALLPANDLQMLMIFQVIRAEPVQPCCTCDADCRDRESDTLDREFTAQWSARTDLPMPRGANI